jgi:SAM-dependent MidA family methyltransferase
MLDAFLTMLPEPRPGMIPFSTFMERSLYDPKWGYYSSGEVDFGYGGDFWTYPHRLSPWFGELVAKRILTYWEGGPFCVVDVAAGHGKFLRDIGNALRRERPEWAADLRVIALDKSDANLEVEGVEFVHASAQDLGDVLPRPFVGAIVANELFDALAADVYRVRDGVCERLLVGADDALDIVLDAPEKDRIWYGAWERVDGEPYLEARTAIRPDRAEAVAAHGPEAAPIALAMGELLAESGARAAAFVFDYGGAAQHIWDAGTREPHIRTYGGEREHDPFETPSLIDLTWDVDFTWIAQKLREGGAEVVFYGVQGALDPDFLLWSPPWRDQIVAQCIKEGFEPMKALLEAWNVVQNFYVAPGFRILAAASPGMPDLGLGESDPLWLDELLTTPAVVPVEALGVLEDAEKIIAALRPGGSPVDDLCDQGLYQRRWEVLEILRAAGS